LSLKGHADYAEYGEDIVCSAVSSIIFGLIGWLENNPDDINTINAELGSGDVEIYCDGGDKTAVAFELVAIGLEQISLKYPDHVTINTIGF
jgi:uncharacterized protein YsxB (DUF464 family)